jgi:hypothetical protein
LLAKIKADRLAFSCNVWHFRATVPFSRKAARMVETSRAHGGGTAPQILRAMENLKLALRLRLSRGPLNEEQINAAAALIDAAAIGVEQIS